MGRRGGSLADGPGGAVGLSHVRPPRARRRGRPGGASALRAGPRRCVAPGTAMLPGGASPRRFMHCPIVRGARRTEHSTATDGGAFDMPPSRGHPAVVLPGDCPRARRRCVRQAVVDGRGARRMECSRQGRRAVIPPRQGPPGRGLLPLATTGQPRPGEGRTARATDAAYMKKPLRRCR